MTDDLAAFLRARLGEDEAVAKDEHERIWFSPYPETIAEREGWLVIQQERALREAEAGRALLADYLQAIDDYAEFDVIRINHLKRAVKWRAAVYSDHPDYRQEWAP